MPTTFNPAKMTQGGCTLGGSGTFFVSLNRFHEVDMAVVAKDGASSGLKYWELTARDPDTPPNNVWGGLVPADFDPIRGIPLSPGGSGAPLLQGGVNAAVFPVCWPGNYGIAAGTGGTVCIGNGTPTFQNPMTVPVWGNNVLRMAANHDLMLMWFAVDNGAWLPGGDPAAGTGGQSWAYIGTRTLFPCGYLWTLGGIRANFGAVPYRYTPPAGATNYG